MQINDPEIQKVPIVDYDFAFTADGKGLALTLWPTFGDSVEETATHYIFKFPRLREVQRVRHDRYLSLKITEGERLDPVELLKRAKEAQAKVKAAKQGKKPDADA